MYRNVLTDERWFTRKLTIEDTKLADGSPVIDKQQIEFERRNGMSDEMIRQEFFCDFDVGNVGSYYTVEMDAMEYDKRLCTFEHRQQFPTFTYWDIGVRDSTAIIWVQVFEGHFNIIDYYEMSNKGVDHYAHIIEEKRRKYNLKYQNHFAPHDIRKREWGASARSMLALAQDFGLNFLITPDVGIKNGIEALRAIFPSLRIHSRCSQLVDALREYRREYDEENRIYSDKPLHNWASNGSDCARYMAVNCRDLFAKPELDAPRKYEIAGFDISQRFVDNSSTSVL